jgi:hypothetical protein
MIRRWLRRAFVLGLLGGAAWAVKQYLDGDAIPASESGPGFPRAEPAPRPIAPAAEPMVETEPDPEPKQNTDPEPDTEPETETVVATEPATTEGVDWVVAEAGEAGPDSHSVKAKMKSGIYHLPGMLNYDRTVPDRWYTSAESAEADGLRRAKR